MSDSSKGIKVKKGKIFHPQILSETKRTNVRLSGKSYYTRSCRTHLTFSTNKKRYNVRVEGSFCRPRLGFPVRNADSCLVMCTEIWSNADAIYVLMDFYLHGVIDKTFGVCIELGAFTFTIFFCHLSFRDSLSIMIVYFTVQVKYFVLIKWSNELNSPPINYNSS